MPSPADLADTFASQAESFTSHSQYDRAAESHAKAAEMYLLAMNDTQDHQATKMLKMLYANHTRQSKDALRRHEDSLVPLVTQPPITSSTESRASLIAQSYMLVNDPLDIDPFEKFWDQVERFVENTSGPVAFATTPLHSQPHPFAHDNGRNMDASAAISASYLFVPNPASASTSDIELENRQLKETIHALYARIRELEKTASEHAFLQTSIVQFRENITKVPRLDLGSRG